MKHAVHATLGFLLLAAGGCGSAAGPDAATAPTRRVAKAPEVVLIPEAQPLDADYQAPARLSANDLAYFREAWAAAAPTVEDAVTPEALVGISRWAVEQTRAAALPRGWTSSLPMSMRGSGPGGVLFGQSAEESTAELPSHSPVVKRRVVVAPVYSAADWSIPRVYISIQGWAEE